MQKSRNTARIRKDSFLSFVIYCSAKLIEAITVPPIPIAIQNPGFETSILTTKILINKESERVTYPRLSESLASMGI